jgi:outer membrane lipoprotein-sorting protein
VVGVVALTANDPSPSLPEVSPAQLVASASQARTDTLSGSVRITTDLKVPGLGTGGVAVLDKVNGTRTGEVAIDGPQRQRFSLTDHGTTYQVVHDGATLWTYDSASRNATRSTVPAEWMDENQWREHVLSPQAYQPQELAQQLLKEFSGSADVKIDGTAKVAGRSAYLLRLVPKDQATSLLVDRVLVSVDSKTNVPLRAQVYQRNGNWPAVDVLFTKVSFDRPAAGTFAFTPPAGATVTQSAVEDNVSAFTRRLGEGVVGSLAGLEGSGHR